MTEPIDVDALLAQAGIDPTTANAGQVKQVLKALGITLPEAEPEPEPEPEPEAPAPPPPPHIFQDALLTPVLPSARVANPRGATPFNHVVFTAPDGATLTIIGDAEWLVEVFKA
ncbi:MAG TPA: hypothetical protein VEJ84_05820 [Acidimicrobiales bacterium]|nr:hypothetical protein [Acidimicrobiales bacterium]